MEGQAIHFGGQLKKAHSEKEAFGCLRGRKRKVMEA
jgi:hypothetical protein